MERGEPLWKNPFEKIVGSDNWIYEIAKKKAKVNNQMFEKNADKQRFFTDKTVFKNYQNEFGDRLSEGNYLDKYIDKPMELAYVNKLRDLYNDVKKTKMIKLTKSDMKKGKLDENATLWDIVKRYKSPLISTASMAGWAVVSPISSAIIKKKIGKAKPEWGRSIMGSLIPGTLAALGTYGLISTIRKPHTDVALAMARERSKMTDDNLLRLLRGDSVQTIKTKEHFI